MELNSQNSQMNNSMNNQMINGMIEASTNSQIINPITSNLMNNGIMMNKIDSQMNNPMISNLMKSHMNNEMKKNQEILINNIQNQINERNNQIDNNIIKNYPINNSLELYSESTIKYYHYPKIEFTEEEYYNSKVLLVVGQSGHGKTTFINALVNIYLGITINDSFRYLLVLNENSNQWQKITIYKIRPKKGLNFPPLILIDTPGFGDIRGEKEDKKHLKQFEDFFKSSLIFDVNCVLYIVNGNNIRFGENDKRILNYLMNLFSKNLKENFVVWATHFTPENKKDIPNFIKILSDENHFYYQRVLKNDKLSREEILKSCWYFASDNKIIYNNEIERNLIEQEKWKNTEMQIKKFIENKLKILEKKNIKESCNVLYYRFQLENEIKSFTEKIERLIPRKIVYEDNLVKLQIYKSKIQSKKDEIKELSEHYKNLLEREKEDKNNINKLENKNDTLNRILNTLNYEEKVCKENIKEYENNYLSVEIDIIKTINNIKNNLDYLRKYALNKESRTIKIFVENYIGNKNDKNQKDVIENLFKIYNDLMEKNFYIDDLNVEQYKKINKY